MAMVMSWRDSRRLPGPSLFWDRPSVILEAALPEARAQEAVALWRAQARRMLDALGWEREETRARLFADGASLVLSAPMDVLNAATLINEWAADAAAAMLEGAPEPSLEPAVAEIAAEIAAERNPALLSLAGAAAAHGVAFVHGDDRVSIGLGSGALGFDERALPAPAAVDWNRAHDVPVVLVTGTNGKSTTVRLLAAIAAAAGRTPGLCTSDWVKVGGEIVDQGDYSGPTGARMVLRDRRVELAVLEIARGGILRRGLPVRRADVAIVTNVAADHLGEYGIDDLEALTEAKLVVARALGPGGRLVLGADDPRLLARGLALPVPPVWFGLADRPPSPGATFCRIADGWMVVEENGGRLPVLPVDAFLIGHGGAARHNLQNGLAAIAGAHALGLPPAAMAAALRAFGADPADNPGRGILRRIGEVELLVDFAHNPHGLRALAPLLAARRRGRLLVALGQAGDRSDADIAALAAAVAELRPDRVLVKEMEHYRRGRPAGEVPRLILAALAAAGLAPEQMRFAGSELELLAEALAWAAPGDLLVLLTHEDRDATMAELDRRAATTPPPPTAATGPAAPASPAGAG